MANPPYVQIDLSDATTSTTLIYPHSDHLNPTRLATNQGGNLVWSWQSDAFGVGQPNTYGGNIDVILHFPAKSPMRTVRSTTTTSGTTTRRRGGMWRVIRLDWMGG